MYKNIKDLHEKELNELFNCDYPTLKSRLNELIQSSIKTSNGALRFYLQEGVIQNIYFNQTIIENSTVINKFDFLKESYDILKNAIDAIDMDEDNHTPSEYNDLEETVEFMAQIGSLLRNVAIRIESVESIRKATIETVSPETRKEIIE